MVDTHAVNISDDDLLTILDMRDNIYYNTFKQQMGDFKLKSLCRFTYYMVTDLNYRTKKEVEKFCKFQNLTYDSMIEFLKCYGIKIKE